MCRRHWFKSPARWLTLPNLVCPSGPAWCPIGLPVECNEITHTYKYMRKSRSNVFRVPFANLASERKRKRKSDYYFDRRRQFLFSVSPGKRLGRRYTFKEQVRGENAHVKMWKWQLCQTNIYIFGIIKKNISLNQSLSDSHNEQDPDNNL